MLKRDTQAQKWQTTIINSPQDYNGDCLYQHHQALGIKEHYLKFVFHKQYFQFPFKVSGFKVWSVTICIYSHIIPNISSVTKGTVEGAMLPSMSRIYFIIDSERIVILQ